MRSAMYHELLVHAAGHSEAGLSEPGVPGVPPDFESSFKLYTTRGNILCPPHHTGPPTLDFQTFLRPCEDPKAVHLERNSLHCTSARLPRAPPLPRRCLHCAAVVYLSSIDSVMVNFSWPLTRPIT